MKKFSIISLACLLMLSTLMLSSCAMFESSKLKLAQYGQSYTVMSRGEDESTDSRVILRVLSETPPTPESKPTAPTLEDYYLYVFGQETSV